MNSSWIIEEIQSAVQRGILVRVDGENYNNYILEELPYLQEEETYMKDYLGDDKGRIVEIMFDRVKIINR